MRSLGIYAYLTSILFLKCTEVCKAIDNYQNGNFLLTPNSKLEVPNSALIDSKMVNSAIQCSMICQRRKLCRSLNVEKGNDGNGSMRKCEILSTNKKERGDLLVSNNSFDHMEVNVSKSVGILYKK